LANQLYRLMAGLSGAGQCFPELRRCGFAKRGDEGRPSKRFDAFSVVYEGLVDTPAGLVLGKASTRLLLASELPGADHR
jgi:hypothetical protein